METSSRSRMRTRTRSPSIRRGMEGINSEGKYREDRNLSDSGVVGVKKQSWCLGDGDELMKFLQAEISEDSPLDRERFEKLQKAWRETKNKMLAEEASEDDEPGEDEPEDEVQKELRVASSQEKQKENSKFLGEDEDVANKTLSLSMVEFTGENGVPSSTTPDRPLQLAVVLPVQRSDGLNKENVSVLAAGIVDRSGTEAIKEVFHRNGKSGAEVLLRGSEGMEKEGGRGMGNAVCFQ